MKATAIVETRAAFGFTQENLASLLGRTARHISKLEHGTTPGPSDEEILLLLYANARAKRPPDLKRILQLKGRLAALRALKTF